MRQRYCSTERALIQCPAAVALCLLIIFVAVPAALAQSGRRAARNPSSATTAMPPAETKPAPAPPVVKQKPEQHSLYVCLSERDSFAHIPFYLSETVRRVFVQRLGEASNLSVTTGGEMHRSEAIKRAKQEESTHVVLLQLEADSFDPRDSNTRNSDGSRLLIHYTVFAPVTGKIKAEGRVYPQQNRTGRGGIGLPSPGRNSTMYSEYLLKEAAREAANRVLSEFSLIRRPGVPGMRTER